MNASLFTVEAFTLLTLDTGVLHLSIQGARTFQAWIVLEADNKSASSTN